ncbi:MAG: DUF892 family protein [Gemmatimonadota bacterium]
MTRSEEKFARALEATYVDEREALESLPEMIAASDSVVLRRALRRLVMPTTLRLLRLKTILGELGLRPGPSPEGHRRTFDQLDARDPAMLEIMLHLVSRRVSSYGRAKTCADEADLVDVAATLAASLDEVMAEGRLMEAVLAPAMGLPARHGTTHGPSLTR